MMEAGHFLSGVAIGYLIVSLCESFFHRIIGHAPPRLRSLILHLRILGRPIMNAWYSHCIVHHFQTYKGNYVTQFSCAKQERALREKLLRQGRWKIVRKRYGLRLGGPGEFLIYLTPTVPLFFVVCWFGGFWFTLGALPFLPLMAMMSEFIHPYLHLSHDQARRNAPPLLRPLIGTSYFRFLSRYHWLHHRYPDHNFNLLFGGDVLLGCYRRPTESDLVDMKAIGLSMPSQSTFN